MSNKKLLIIKITPEVVEEKKSEKSIKNDALLFKSCKIVVWKTGIVVDVVVDVVVV